MKQSFVLLGFNRLKNRKSIAALVFLLISLGLFGWCNWPLPHGHQSLIFSPQNLENLQPGVTIPDFLRDEQRTLVIDYPATIRQGQTGWIKLQWAVKQNSVDVIPDDVSPANVLVDARLDLLGIRQTPGESIDAPLIPGRTLLVQWQIYPEQAGVFTGSVLSALDLSPFANNTTDPQASENFIPVAIQDIQIKVIDLVGLGIDEVTWAAAASLVIAFGLVSWGFLTGPNPGRRKRLKNKHQVR